MYKNYKATVGNQNQEDQNKGFVHFCFCASLYYSCPTAIYVI